MRLRRGETGQVVAAAAAAALLGLGSNRLLTEVVAPVELGRLYLFSNLAVWLTLPALASSSFVARHWPLAAASGQSAALLRGLWVGVGGQAALAFLGAAALGALGLVPLGPASWPLLAVAGAAGAAGLLLEPIPVAARHRRLAGLLSLAATPARQALLAAAGWAAGAAWLGAAHAAHALGYALLAWLLVRRLRRGDGGAAPAAPEIRLSLAGYLRFTAPTLATTALALVVASAERWGLAAHADLAATALFAQALGLASAAVGALAGLLSSLHVPVVAEAAGADTRPVAAAARPLARYLRLAGLALGALVLAGWWLAEPAALLLLGPRYQAVGRLLPVTLAGASLVALGQALQIVPWLARQTAWPALARLASHGAYLGLLLVPWRTADLAMTFCWCHLAAQAAFAGLMALAALHEATRGRRAAQPAPVAP